MNGAYWNPITWIIALTTGYNAYSITIEQLFYVLAGGIGLYKLSKHFTENYSIRLIAAIAYMCNGFVIGHLQHLNWISSSAFLPWCIWGILAINKSGRLKYYCITTIAFLLFISSAHPGMTIGAIYFFIPLVFFLLYNRYKEQQRPALISGLQRFSFLFVLVFISCIGIIVSYADILPFFVRNAKVSLSLSLSENTNFQSWISLFVPFGTVKGQSFFGNDIALRNIYFSLTLAVFFIASFFSLKTKRHYFFFFTGIFFFLISLGGAIKLFAHNYLPLIGYVRVNAEFRIFTIICFILTAIDTFTYYTTHPEFRKTIAQLINVLLVSLACLLTFSFIKLVQGNSVLTSIDTTATTNWRDILKLFIDQIQFFDTLFLHSLIQIILLLFLKKALTQELYSKVLLLTALDVIIATFLHMPFTGVGKVPVARINAIHKQSPYGVPTPKLQPLMLHDTIPNADSALVGDWSFYNKQIGKAKPVLYPVKLKNNYEYYAMLEKDSNISVANFSFVFLSSSIKEDKLNASEFLKQENIQAFTMNNLQLSFNAKEDGYLVYLQNYYPHWQYKNNNSTGKVLKAGTGFIAVPVQKGNNNINLYFSWRTLKLLLIFSFMFLFILAALLFFPIANRILFQKK
ncbi:YfhO family protein [Lacibacter luteus]|nr:YfhO family protein [Lacibacter luteus]